MKNYMGYLWRRPGGATYFLVNPEDAKELSSSPGWRRMEVDQGWWIGAIIPDNEKWRAPTIPKGKRVYAEAEINENGWIRSIQN